MLVERAMQQVMIDIPDETLLALKLVPAGAAQELRLAAAVKLYELGRLSSGGRRTVGGHPAGGVPFPAGDPEGPSRPFWLLAPDSWQ